MPELPARLVQSDSLLPPHGMTHRTRTHHPPTHHTNAHHYPPALGTDAHHYPPAHYLTAHHSHTSSEEESARGVNDAEDTVEDVPEGCRGLDLPHPRKRSYTYGGQERPRPHAASNNPSWPHAVVRRGSQCPTSLDVSLQHSESASTGGFRRSLSAACLRLLHGHGGGRDQPAQRILRSPRRRQTSRGLSGLTIDAVNQWSSGSTMSG